MWDVHPQMTQIAQMLLDTKSEWLLIQTALSFMRWCRLSTLPQA